MDRSLLVRIFGYRACFIHGDTAVLDRWNFVSRHLPKTRNGERVFDAGCGTGAFSIGLAARGYDTIGLSWDERNQKTAQDRAGIIGLTNVSFPIGDLRNLGAMDEFVGRFEYVLSLENIEHVIDDRKLMLNLAKCLKPGGWLVLSTPNKDYKAVTPEDDGPFETTENGWHVRRGYTSGMLEELCELSGLVVEEVGSCTGFISQKLTWLIRRGGKLGWLLALPLRLLPPLIDPLIAKLFRYPDFSITLVAYKPRFGR